MSKPTFAEWMYVPTLHRRIESLEAELAEAKAFAETLSDELDEANSRIAKLEIRLCPHPGQYIELGVCQRCGKKVD